MLFGPFIVIAILVILIIAFLALVAFDDGDTPTLFTIFVSTAIGTLILTLWCTYLFASQPWQVETTTIKQVGEHEEVQFIVDDTGEDIKLININTKFNKRFDVGTDIKITRYKTGPYAGFYTSIQRVTYTTHNEDEPQKEQQ